MSPEYIGVETICLSSKPAQFGGIWVCFILPENTELLLKVTGFPPCTPVHAASSMPSWCSVSLAVLGVVYSMFVSTCLVIYYFFLADRKRLL